jgi:MFS family permease
MATLLCTQDVTKRRSGMADILSVHNFRLLWIGESVSLLGNQFFALALPWMILQNSGSGPALGSTLMTIGIARALFLLWGGAAVDRFSARAMMIVSNIMRCVVVSIFTIMVFLGEIRLWRVYLLCAIFGMFDAFFFPAFRSILPAIVERRQLQAGNALLDGSQQFAQLLGPALAGLVIAIHGLGLQAAFGLDALSFVVSMFTLLKIHPPMPFHTAVASESNQSVLSSIREGLRHTAGNAILRGLTIYLTVVNFALLGPFTLGICSLAKGRFGSVTALGLMLSAFGAGALLGSMFVGILTWQPRPATVAISMSTALGLGLPLLAVTPTLPSACLLLGAMSFVSGFGDLFIICKLQSVAEPRMVGRIMSIAMTGTIGISPLSYGLAGLAIPMGVSRLFLLSGFLIMLAGAWAANNRALWQESEVAIPI